ncbi:nuclear transport factor 2 family protein [Parahaliea sp. F7430]|uniref:Nuclear transport factor 2 family protein n=1 Tax=Sediminihaliea albiluteola TaxID=2758564 RepID=A0A7W2TWV8_9GAMM|nr:nuclear transport factor 2 family protein [Sediminihaliea albiluteola]MBA6413438.1 nuclear transport factor 2 family protein [Sediminihaliea albiluteola]
MFDNEHPARRAALLSRQYVHEKNREGWLSLYAEDAIIEDPIGVSHIDPVGDGHRGPAAREAFWDNFIAPANINIEILESYAAGKEVANHVLLTVTVDSGEGKKIQQNIHGVFTYEVNDEGKLLALRGYWETDDPRNAMMEFDEQGNARPLSS